ncbi:chloramphenicol O-acetyltransferase type A [Enterobacter sp. BIGb0383]|uniref:type A chloramphenicol O-acetyltransferase n=1 Tax=unclassified Enterobacter TaxID=2608935 RepID=UPI000F479455|nr:MULTISPECIES: type A chloramphenicol O-acetyltransferase [unclassified Enterobacter]ROP62234.1 chloramphenicol O-acetyltransferase type A [Enterobacter sp. BIGb0383]ROS12395.1 chloramphenicol O-acetyltransferase type A [Enterobacter sp. BIGb0359]
MEKKRAGYTAVDVSRWVRKEHYEAFQSFAQCAFSQTVQLDITALLQHIKTQGWTFYPTMIYLISRLLNKYPEFRMAIKDGELVIWDEIHPAYTIFHEQTETFSSICSPYHEDISQFLNRFSNDVARYRDDLAYLPQKDPAENIFFISANPWVSFTSFNLNVPNITNFFAPMFTIGKYYPQGDKVLMPLAVQVHHAVCDGFHVGRLVNALQAICDDPQRHIMD